MKSRTLRIVSLWLAVAAAISAVLPLHRAAASELPYETYYKDGFGQLVHTQAAYIPAGIIGYNTAIAGQGSGSADSTGKLQLNQPKDLFIDQKDHVFIADTGNNRIVELDAQGAFIRQITVDESPLNKPSGVFVHPNGDIYIADTGNNRIVRLNAGGKLLKEYGRPDTDYIPASFKYDPVNLVVDKRGFLYVTSLGAFQGLIELDPDGQFVSFFGPNRVSFSVFDAFKRLVYTREMYQRELKKLPGAIANAAIDNQGFIYTVTKEVASDQIKKLNIAGLDQLPGKGDFSSVEPVRSYGEVLKHRAGDMNPQLNDITVDESGNMTVVDTVWNMISQYDQNGNLLFFWGGDAITATSKTGVVKTPAAIANDSKGNLYVLDNTNNLIQVLRPSEFGKLVHQANALTQEGKYEESEPIWEEVHRLNTQYTPALIGLAKAAYKRQDYERAAQLYSQAGVVGGYSDSFWQNRLIWFQNNFGLAMNFVLAAGILFLAWGKWSRKLLPAGGLGGKLRMDIPFAKKLGHVFTIARHPVDGFYGIRHEQKANLLSSLIILIAAAAAFGYMQAGTNFVFNPKVHVGIDLLPQMVQFFGLWFGWVVSNYLVSSLLRGEGRFRDVFYGSCYALFPIILIGIPVTYLSNALTLDESAIYHFLKLAAVIWVVLLAVWMVQGVHNYTFIESVFIILLSIFTLLIIVILIFLFVSLSYELVNFIKSIYQEVIIR
ncbi:YIP1 family protein [Paenibacillus protaetiae]|uniref:Nuclease PIN n=1 Tax=Paenibacillus protaetiae TaxID=2509456 RepID=A0A4V0YET7_9BACL|nr:YIP1 family protein [Paenibacillus protaetiae]QAY65351.1 nuclease PIN [Paenibacillus protaetiae]